MLNFVPMTDPTAFSWFIHPVDLNTHTNPLDQGLPLIQKQSYCSPGLLRNCSCLFKSIKINSCKSLRKQGYFALTMAYLGLA